MADCRPGNWHFYWTRVYTWLTPSFKRPREMYSSKKINLWVQSWEELVCIENNCIYIWPNWFIGQYQTIFTIGWYLPIYRRSFCSLVGKHRNSTPLHTFFLIRSSSTDACASSRCEVCLLNTSSTTTFTSTTQMPSHALRFYELEHNAIRSCELVFIQSDSTHHVKWQDS